MTKQIITLGKTREDEPVNIPVNVLKRHIVALGASGSGKTVISKCIIEEAVRNNIPSIIIDPQGDFASLGIISDPELTISHGTDPSIIAEYTERSEVRIFTPASTKGLALSIHPFKLPPGGQSLEQAIQTLDVASINLIQLMGFRLDSDEGEAAKNYLYRVLDGAWKNGIDINDTNELLALLSEPSQVNIETDLISERVRDKLLRKMQYLSTGMSQLMFDLGTQFNIETMMTPVHEGKVPINIIYLNTLTSDIHKQFFVSSIGREVYSWMLQNPSDNVHLLFCIDEVAPFLPPHPNNPPAKAILKMLFKQARKYGVSCLMCTQNPADIDYKAMAQSNTWLLGRLMAKQDLSKVRHMIRRNESTIVDELPKLKSGEFILICPDVYDTPLPMRVRWLVTKHETLDEDSLSEVMSAEIREYFEVTSLEPAPEIPVPENRSDPGPTGGSTTTAGEAPAEKGDIDMMFEMNFHQNKAIRRVQSYLTGTLFGKTETVVDATLKLFPVWQVTCNVDKHVGPLGLDMNIPFISKSITVEDTVYFSSIGGELLSLERGRINFLKVLPENRNRIRDLNMKRVHLVEMTADDTIGTVMQPRLSAKKASNLARAMFGVEVVGTRLTRLPIWIFTIENQTGKKRTLLLDGMLGKEVMGIELRS